MRTITFRTVCGASGDMILAALIDLGVDANYLNKETAKLGIEGLQVGVGKAKMGGIACSRMELAWSEQKSYRHLPQILNMIDGKGYPPRVLERCKRVLRRLAEAESKVHGIAVEKVHFHEIGAVDTIIDVLGACLCLEYLQVDRVVFSTLTVGYGTIDCEHGIMPVPVPATAEMLRGLRFSSIDVPTEILTPTGCAILTALGEQTMEHVAGTLLGVGYGCGTKIFQRYPNVLRTELVDDEAAEDLATDSVAVLESDIDHISGEVLGFTAEELLAGGALDVSWCPLAMKKGRPGYRLTVIAKPGDETRLAALIMKQTRTLGVRVGTISRFVARRAFRTTTFYGEEHQEKVCRIGETTFSKLEYEALAALARRRGIPLVELMNEYGRERRGGDNPIR
ncbi:MAG: nickel pincer cofactor biosynthesis protein LarC [Chitinivibrionales bacterium]|nr:nickel pincer cofactor biosynthesis protein LarC [Chitinivibrionales bacterium]MBD3357408.1 nickel pincer cofactor biosynthesis protein LarC [Chitinivibrionales bacterium]